MQSRLFPCIVLLSLETPRYIHDIAANSGYVPSKGKALFISFALELSSKTIIRRQSVTGPCDGMKDI